MPTCPNCGEIVMNGDPYCPHCGATFRWVDEEYEMKREKYKRPLEVYLKDVPISRFNESIDKLQEYDHITIRIKKSFDLTNAKNTLFDLRQDYPSGDIRIFFKRQNKYFTTTDYVTYSCVTNEIESHGFDSNFYNLENTEWFKNAVRQKERETGLEYQACGGGYDAYFHWKNPTFEIKDGCSVIAHFIKNEYTTLGYEVDFINHRLKMESESYDRASPYDLVADFDWV